MKEAKMLIMFVFVTCLVLTMTTSRAGGGEMKLKLPTPDEVSEWKRVMDDPRPFIKNGYFKEMLPPEIYAKFTYDVETMKKAWPDAVGFKAPDVVGKIAPEIKPGKYTYQDKEKFPGLKELMDPLVYERFNPGGPPFTGNFSEMTIIPTRQYYYPLPVAEATNQYRGQTKLDDQGYIIDETYVAGHPFPQPSGKSKAHQMCYNLEKYLDHWWESTVDVIWMCGFDRKLNQDSATIQNQVGARTSKRVCMPPLGYLDKRAEEEGERVALLGIFIAPRDQYGNAQSITSYHSANKQHRVLMYFSMLRRVRRLSGTDMQDQMAGSDVIIDDGDNGFSQKMTPDIYPMSYEVIEEREFLFPALSLDGAVYVDSKTTELCNLEFERRPVMVLQLTELDKNYVYSKRVLYVDKETMVVLMGLAYDQKERLYRTLINVRNFIPEIGVILRSILNTRDYRDQHSTIVRFLGLPYYGLTRDDVDLGSMLRKMPK